MLYNLSKAPTQFPASIWQEGLEMVNASQPLQIRITSEASHLYEYKDLMNSY